MATRSSTTAARLTAMGTGLCLLASCAACGAEPTTTPVEPQEKASAGAVAVFTPSDGITISQRTPLSKWAKFVPELTKQLTALGVDKADIETSTADGLDKQSRQVQDWVVSHMTGDADTDDADADAEDEATTIIVAPAVETDEATRQYGDYVTRPHVTAGTDDADDDSDAVQDADDSDASDASKSKDDDAENEDENEEDAVERLASALRLARSSGMHVVLLANGVEGFKPDAFVSMSTGEQIGRTQAAKLVAKLDLAKTDERDPQAIELLIPHSPVEDDAQAETETETKTSDAASSEGTNEKAGGETDEPETASDAFAREAFAGAWQILQPYFTQGKAYSPSGLLTKDTTDDDWRDVTVDATDAASIAKALDERLLHADGDAATEGKEAKDAQPSRVDGVIAMNDYVASAVIDELAALGYVGSSADVNPSISISDIVGGSAGRKDLEREAVPAPAADANAGEDASDDAETQDGPQADDPAETADENAAWPVVTGFGGYVDTMPQVVNGKQWMTGLENRVSLAADTAQVTVRLNQGKGLKGLSYVSKQAVDGVKGKVNVVNEELLAVSASNLKTALIDPGYITMAEAGL